MSLVRLGWFGLSLPRLIVSDVGVGVGAGAGICLELEPEPEISKMGGSGNPDKNCYYFKDKLILCFICRTLRPTVCMLRLFYINQTKTNSEVEQQSWTKI